MRMNDFVKILESKLTATQPSFGDDADSVLGFLCSPLQIHSPQLALSQEADLCQMRHLDSPPSLHLSSRGPSSQLLSISDSHRSLSGCP